jgi:SAM-dependent methyltransferase
VGVGDFKYFGELYLNYFIKYGGLRPDDRVLDIGCGLGRMALPLTRFLSRKGSYHGFDVNPEHIQWAQSRIAPRHRRFRFEVLDIFNKCYNPGGKHAACDYRFPLDDHSFDFVFLTSVFTHMAPRETDHYLSEIWRLLRPGGRCFATFFLLNEKSKDAIRRGTSHIPFQYDLGGYVTSNQDIPEAAIAVEENLVREMFAKNQLRIDEPILRGTWTGRADFNVEGQDIIIAAK